MEVFAMDKDFFLVKLGNDQDYFKALSDGPWVIFDHYLVVQQWTPAFRFTDKLPSTMVVWVQFPGFPVHFYHKDLLFSLGNLIGKAIKLDFHTLHQQHPVLCPEQASDRAAEFSPTPTTASVEPSSEEVSGFGPWMLVTRKARHNQREIPNQGRPDQAEESSEGTINKQERKERSARKENGQPPNQAGSKSPQRKQGPQATQGGNTNKKGKEENKKGKEVALVASEVEKTSGILGPIPRSEGPSSRKSSVSPNTNDASSSGPKEDGLNVINPIGLVTQLVREKRKEERRTGEEGIDTRKSTPIRHSPMKPLKIWSPVKDRRNKGQDRRISLTLQQIKEWTEMSSENRDVEALREYPLPADDFGPKLTDGSGPLA
ncbi:unnamed protein product [Linum trigynum]|uniref:DUF4283 domain-containing protein n=1 Tax=Linum trigynum TaxID=586398 RepID=A0AAV2GRC3_9ROSI